MKRGGVGSLARILGLASSLLLVSVPPVDAAQRTFVSGQGNDNNACSLAAPCRSFAVAIDHTDIKGEIVVLDSAGYGPVLIDKSVAIIAPPGIYGGITATAGNGIDINGSGIAVTLRGLTINGQGGDHGILVTSAARVYIESCVVSNFDMDGIRVGLPATFGGEIRVTDSMIRANGGYGIDLINAHMTVDNSNIDDNGLTGIRVDKGHVSVTRSSLSGNTGPTGSGLLAVGTSGVALATVSDSLIAGNHIHGLAAIGANPGTAHLVAHTNVVSDTQVVHGIFGTGPVMIAASRNVVTRSGNFAFRQVGVGTFHSYNDNFLVDNPVGTRTGAFASAQYE